MESRQEVRKVRSPGPVDVQMTWWPVVSVISPQAMASRNTNMQCSRDHGAGCFSSGVWWWQFSCHLGGFLGGFPLLSGHQDVDFTTATPQDIIPEDSKLTMFGVCTLVWIYFVFVELQQKMTSIEQFPTKTGWFHLKGLISLERNLVNQLTSIR